MTNVINPIIHAGGTTAFEAPLSIEDLGAITLDKPTIISVLVALDSDGVVAGFQYLNRMDDPAAGDIATFARLTPKVPGAGRALMVQTCIAARAAGLTAIRAKIRSDNAPGLGFYSAMGFQDHSVIPGVPLSDGTPVDRVLKWLTL